MVAALDRYAVDRAAPDTGRLATVLHDHEAVGCYLYSLDPLVTGAVAYARSFNPAIRRLEYSRRSSVRVRAGQLIP